MNTTNYDVCCVSHIYNDDFQFSLPQSILESYLSGKAFDHHDVYNADESKRLHLDINELFQFMIAVNPVKDNLAVITAGAPGAGKTIKLRQDLEKQMLAGQNFAYVDPDDVCLKNQTNTYCKDLENSGQSMIDRQNAYNKWRPGSNAAAQLILANLIREKFAFYYGMTSTSPQTFRFFDFLKKHGYHIRLLHVSTPDDVRWESIKERNLTFIQTTEQDTKDKGLLLPQRITDTYLKYADEIEFYYRDKVKQDAVLTAKWLRNDEDSAKKGKLQIMDLEGYQKIKAIHNEMVQALNQPDLYWESSVEEISEIITN